MAVVYRYTDLADETIKYIGIVWSGNRTLKQRVAEHKAYDEWCKNGAWRIEYLKHDVESRTDAEMLESHYIAKYGTDQYFNIRKNGWGESSFVDDETETWELYSTDEEQKSTLFEFHELRDLSFSWTRESPLFGAFSLLSIETDDATFLIDPLAPLSIKLPTAGGYLGSHFIGVDLRPYMLAVLKQTGLIEGRNIREDVAQVAYRFSEITGDLECIYFINKEDDEAYFAFYVEPDAHQNNVYNVRYSAPAGECTSEDLVDIEEFIKENGLTVYDWIEPQATDALIYNQRLKRAVATGNF